MRVLSYEQLWSICSENEIGIGSVEITKVLFKQLLKAVKHLHSYGIAHFDIKAENCLLTSDGEFSNFFTAQKSIAKPLPMLSKMFWIEENFWALFLWSLQTIVSESKLFCQRHSETWRLRNGYWIPLRRKGTQTVPHKRKSNLPVTASYTSRLQVRPLLFFWTKNC